jgi:hypothetical protein
MKFLIELSKRDIETIQDFVYKPYFNSNQEKMKNLLTSLFGNRVSGDYEDEGRAKEVDK